MLLPLTERTKKMMTKMHALFKITYKKVETRKCNNKKIP